MIPIYLVSISPVIGKIGVIENIRIFIGNIGIIRISKILHMYNAMESEGFKTSAKCFG